MLTQTQVAKGNLKLKEQWNLSGVQWISHFPQGNYNTHKILHCARRHTVNCISFSNDTEHFYTGVNILTRRNTFLLLYYWHDEIPKTILPFKRILSIDWKKPQNLLFFFFLLSSRKDKFILHPFLTGESAKSFGGHVMDHLIWRMK